MIDFQRRVINEQRELDQRAKALDEFINHNPLFSSLSEGEQKRLIRQLGAMHNYSAILSERIDAFAPQKAASHPDVPRPSNDELVELARDVVDAIEKCGASRELTHAVMLASDLYCYLRKPVQGACGSAV